MQHHRRVFARFHHFVQVADRARLHGARDRPVDPARLLALEQVPPEIATTYTARPETTERVRALAHRVTAGATTDYDKIVADARLLESRILRIGMLPFHIGGQWAKFLITTGEVITAERAKSIGLALEVVPAADLSARVQALGEYFTLYREQRSDAERCAIAGCAGVWLRFDLLRHGGERRPAQLQDR